MSSCDWYCERDICCRCTHCQTAVFNASWIIMKIVHWQESSHVHTSQDSSGNCSATTSRTVFIVSYSVHLERGFSDSLALTCIAFDISCYNFSTDSNWFAFYQHKQVKIWFQNHRYKCKRAQKDKETASLTDHSNSSCVDLRSTGLNRSQGPIEQQQQSQNSPSSVSPHLHRSASSLYCSHKAQRESRLDNPHNTSDLICSGLPGGLSPDMSNCSESSSLNDYSQEERVGLQSGPTRTQPKSSVGKSCSDYDGNVNSTDHLTSLHPTCGTMGRKDLTEEQSVSPSPSSHLDNGFNFLRYADAMNTGGVSCIPEPRHAFLNQTSNGFDTATIHLTRHRGFHLAAPEEETQLNAPVADPALISGTYQFPGYPFGAHPYYSGYGIHSTPYASALQTPLDKSRPSLFDHMESRGDRLLIGMDPRKITSTSRHQSNDSAENTKPVTSLSLTHQALASLNTMLPNASCYLSSSAIHAPTEMAAPENPIVSGEEKVTSDLYRETRRPNELQIVRDKLDFQSCKNYSDIEAGYTTNLPSSETSSTITAGMEPSMNCTVLTKI